MEAKKRKLLAELASQDSAAEALGAARSAGYSAAEALGAARSAGYSAAEVEEWQEDWDSIPVLIKPYSRMLRDIEAGERIHDQSTFGPDCDPSTNLCKTPMCTAGHLVNQAG